MSEARDKEAERAPEVSSAELRVFCAVEESCKSKSPRNCGQCFKYAQELGTKTVETTLRR